MHAQLAMRESLHAECICKRKYVQSYKRNAINYVAGKISMCFNCVWVFSFFFYYTYALKHYNSIIRAWKRVLSLSRERDVCQAVAMVLNTHTHTHSAAVAEDCQSVNDMQIAPSGGVESVSV